MGFITLPQGKKFGFFPMLQRHGRYCEEAFFLIPNFIDNLN